MKHIKQGYGGGMSKLLLGDFVTLIAGCASVASISTGTGAMPVHERPTYNSPQQVVYRVDEHRYITLENYRDCRVGGIMKWNDDRKNLHAVIEKYPTWGSGIWQGKFKIDPGDERIAIATFGCGDKNCHVWINFSNDGGLTWDAFSSESFSHSYYSPNRNSYTRSDIEATEVRVTKDGYIYVIPKNKKFFYRYRLNGTKDQSPEGTATGDERCWPGEGLKLGIKEHIDWVESCEENRVRKPPFPPMEPGKYDMYDLASIPDVKTPSSQERFTCDPSLNPVVEGEEE
jgi:hypothetical protein